MLRMNSGYPYSQRAHGANETWLLNSPSSRDNTATLTMNSVQVMGMTLTARSSEPYVRD